MTRNRMFAVAPALVLALVWAVAASPALAQSGKMTSPTIAVIDMQKIMRESKAVQSIQEKIEAQRSNYQQDLSRKEQALREADEELARQRTILSSEAFEEKRQQLEGRASQLQRDIQKRKRELDRNYGQAIQEVQRELANIVSTIMQDRGIDVVMTKTSVFLVHKDLEITDVALERLNESLTSVDVPSLQN